MTERILLVTPVFTHPPIQGNAARVLAFGRQLRRRGFDVDVLHYDLDGASPESLRAMRAEWSAVHRVPAQPHRRMARPSHWGLDDWCPDELVKEVEGQVRQGRYAAVVVNYVWLSRAFEGAGRALRILDTHDLFGGRHTVSLSYGLEPNWYFTTEAEENRGFSRADVVVAIQDVERTSIAARTASRVMTVGHPVAPYFAAYEDSDTKVATFGYLGSANPWNQKCIADFDAAAARRGGLDWALAGTICRAGLDLRTVRYVFGSVDRAEDFYRHVGCCINPMASGTGLKIKTIEAMAYGRPIIGTRVAFEGLETRHPFHRLEDSEELVTAAREYAVSDAARRELANASMRLYLTYMDGVRRQYDALADAIRAGR